MTKTMRASALAYDAYPLICWIVFNSLYCLLWLYYTDVITPTTAPAGMAVEVTKEEAARVPSANKATETTSAVDKAALRKMRPVLISTGKGASVKTTSKTAKETKAATFMESVHTAPGKVSFIKRKAPTKETGEATRKSKAPKMVKARLVSFGKKIAIFFKKSNTSRGAGGTTYAVQLTRSLSRNSFKVLKAEFQMKKAEGEVKKAETGMKVIKAEMMIETEKMNKAQKMEKTEKKSRKTNETQKMAPVKLRVSNRRVLPCSFQCGKNYGIYPGW